MFGHGQLSQEEADDLPGSLSQGHIFGAVRVVFFP